LCFPSFAYLLPWYVFGQGRSQDRAADPTLDLHRWNDLLSSFEKLRRDDIANHRMSASDPIVVHKWFPGGHIYRYVAYPLKMRLIGLGDLNDLHKFHWLNAMYGSIKPGSNACFISTSNYFTDPKPRYSEKFSIIDKAATVTQKREGEIALHWYVYRLRKSR